MKKTCLTIDCSGVNKNGSGRFRTEANNPDKQVCYFNGQNNDQMFNVFTSTKINQQETEKGIYFQIDRVRSKMNKDIFEANTLLRQNSARNDSSKSGYRPAENRYGLHSDVQGSKRRDKKQKIG